MRRGQYSRLTRKYFIVTNQKEVKHSEQELITRRKSLFITVFNFVKSEKLTISKREAFFAAHSEKWRV